MGIQAMLEHGLYGHKRIAADALATQSFELAQHRSSSYVLETAIVHCDSVEQQLLAASLLNGGARNIEAMACSQSGNRVLKALLMVDSVAAFVWQMLNESASY